LVHIPVIYESFVLLQGLLGIKTKISFEGEAAIQLEAICHPTENGRYQYEIEDFNGTYIVNTDKIIKEVLNDLKENMDKSIIARKFHNTVVSFSLEMCKLLREKYGIHSVALSGGVFQNEILLMGLYKELIESNFKVYIHKEIPCNDGGVSVGQPSH